MKDAGENNKTFAQAIDISENSATNYLKKGRVPEPDILVRISKYYKKSIDWLLQDLSEERCQKEYSEFNDSQMEYVDIIKAFKAKPLIKEIHDILLEIENEDTERLREIKGFLRFELNRVKGGDPIDTTSQQFRALENRIARIEQAAHIHNNDRLRHDDPLDRKEEILNRRSVPLPITQ